MPCARDAPSCRGLVTGGHVGRRPARCAGPRRMQRVRQPADPTFTIGSPTLHRADGSSHAERRCGCSCQKGPFLPWITPTPSVRPTPTPTPPRLTRPRARPPVRRARSAAGVREAANAVAAARVALLALPEPRMTRTTRPSRSTTATTSSCRSRFARAAPPSRRPNGPSFASRASATPCRCRPRHRPWQCRLPSTSRGRCRGLRRPARTGPHPGVSGGGGSRRGGHHQRIPLSVGLPGLSVDRRVCRLRTDRRTLAGCHQRELLGSREAEV